MDTLSHHLAPKKVVEMNNKKAQCPLCWVLLIVGIIIGIGIYHFGFGIEGAAPIVCDFEKADYEVIGKIICEGKGGWLENKDCSIQIKNLENQPAEFTPAFNCRTLDSSEMVPAEKQALSSGEIGTFTIKYDNKGLNWECVLGPVESSKVQKCHPAEE